jgi:HK97 family phage major capsid protein
MADNINTYVQTLYNESRHALEEQRALLDKITAERRLPSAEEQAFIERTDKAMDDADAEIDRWLKRSERDRVRENARGELDAVLSKEQRQDSKKADSAEERSLEDFLRGRSAGDVQEGRRGFTVDLVPAARALTLARQGAGRDEFRALSIVTAAAGGTLVPTQFSTILLQAFETLGGPIECGCEVLETTNGDSFVYFTEATAGTAAIVGEGSALAANDPTFGRVTLGAYKYAELIQISNELITDVQFDLLGYVAKQAGKALARITNTGFTTGSGTNAPQGFVVGGGNGGTAQTSATGVPSYDNLIDLVYNVSDEGYLNSNTKIVTKFSNIGALRKIKDTTNQPIWQPGMQAGQPSQLLGFTLKTNPSMRSWATAAGTGTIAVGDFGEGYVVRRVGQVRFERSDDYAFNTDQVTFRAVMRVDGKVKQAGAIRALREPTT